MKVLFDLSMAALGFSGMPLDTRLLFILLNKMESLDVSGLLYQIEGVDTLNFPFKEGPNSLLSYSNYFSLFEGMSDNRSRIKILRILEYLRGKYALFLKNKYDIQLLPDNYFRETVYRTFFEKGVMFDDFNSSVKNKFYVSNIVNQLLSIRAVLSGILSTPTLNTAGFDVIIHEDSRVVKVSKTTQKIVRYHDIFPVTDPDLFGNAYVYSKIHYKSIQKNIDFGAVYVCNSEPTKNSLIQAFPKLEGRTFTIPYAISPLFEPKEKVSFSSVKSIIDRRLSPLNAKKDPCEKLTDMEYIIQVGSIEPRKNYINTMKALLILKDKYKRKIKLVIAGGMGWRNDAILSQVKTLSKLGDVIYLESVYPEELCTLYAYAKATVFPSLAEGFGLPPVEALKVGCPVISSDIEVHRWVQGNAAQYANPYDPESIAKAIESVLKLNPSERERVIKKGYEQANLYSDNRISGLWKDFFATEISERVAHLQGTKRNY